MGLQIRHSRQRFGVTLLYRGRTKLTIDSVRAVELNPQRARFAVSFMLTIPHAPKPHEIWLDRSSLDV